MVRLIRLLPSLTFSASPPQTAPKSAATAPRAPPRRRRRSRFEAPPHLLDIFQVVRLFQRGETRQIDTRQQPTLALLIGGSLRFCRLGSGFLVMLISQS